MAVRVVSVSPRDAAPPAAEPVNGTTPGGDHAAFVTPRVLDQAAFEELASTLRALLDEAAAMVERLSTRLEEAHGADDGWARVAGHLQERLRLSARMLDAFQSQIERVESAIAALDEHETRVDESCRRLDERLAAFDDEATNHAREALAGLDTDVSSREGRLDAIDDRLAALESRTHAMAQQLETAEIDTAMLSSRVDGEAKQLAETMRALAAGLEQAFERRR